MEKRKTGWEGATLRGGAMFLEAYPHSHIPKYIPGNSLPEGAEFKVLFSESQTHMLS